MAAYGRRLGTMIYTPPSSLYKTSPLPKFGIEIHGIQLSQNLPDDVIEAIKEDVTTHRLVLFRNQTDLSGDRHVEISHWFGELESTFYKHPKSPHPDVFRVSNDRSEGGTGVGRTGWHVDGSFQPAPFSHSLYHMVSAIKGGDTRFAPLNEVIESCSSEQRSRWERLWMCSDRRGGTIKPLIYAHPRTGIPTLCFHTGMIEAFVWDYGTPKQVATTREETIELLEELEQKFALGVPDLVYTHQVSNNGLFDFTSFSLDCTSHRAVFSN